MMKSFIENIFYLNAKLGSDTTENGLSKMWVAVWEDVGGGGRLSEGPPSRDRAPPEAASANLSWAELSGVSLASTARPPPSPLVNREVRTRMASPQCPRFPSAPLLR